MDINIYLRKDNAKVYEEIAELMDMPISRIIALTLQNPVILDLVRKEVGFNVGED